MGKNKILIPAGLVVVIILVFVFSLLYFSKYYSSTKSQNPSGQSARFADIQIPKPDDKPTDRSVAVPTFLYPIPGGNNHQREFDLKISGDRLPVNKMIVLEGDIVHINLTSADKPYDLAFPALSLSQEVVPGSRKVMEFKVISSGTYDFICGKCGGQKGILEVVPNNQS